MLVGWCECKMRGHHHDGIFRLTRKCGGRSYYKSLIGDKTYILCDDCADLIQTSAESKE